MENLEQGREKLPVYERNMIQIEILRIVGFESSDPESVEWLSEHRREISDFIDSGPQTQEIRELAKEEKFREAAELVVEALGLSRD